MSLKFKDDCLVDEKGNIFPISYESIREECLRHPFNTLSISTIIFESIKKMTGEKVLHVNNTYNSSPLFIRLEKDVQNDERYKRAKEKFQKQLTERNQQQKEGREIYRISNTRMIEVNERILLLRKLKH